MPPAVPPEGEHPDKMEEDVPEKVTDKDAAKKAGGAEGKDAKDGKKKKDEKKEDELSEEDLALKESLELLVTRVQDEEAGVQKLALESMRQEIRTATSSMTSVPKPLKFLRPHYKTLNEAYEVVADENKVFLADVLSVLAMTMSEANTRESLKFRLLGSADQIGDWGHEYVRNLAGEIGQDYQEAILQGRDTKDLMNLVNQIVPFHVKHNAEPDAVDLLMEVDSLPSLEVHITEQNYRRTCLYLTSCASYVPTPDDILTLEVAYRIYYKVKDWPDALRVALRMNNTEYVKRVFREAEGLEKKQLAYIMARQGFWLNLEEHSSLADESERELIQEIINNGKLTEGYLALARDLDVMEPKTPDEIYKTHLVDGRTGSSAVSMDSARQNLAATFVNGLVNAGFGKDKLVTAPAEGSADGAASSNSWLFKNKEHGKISAVASLGLIMLWDMDGGLPQIDKYLYSQDNHIVAGALLGVGVINCGVRNEVDPAFALLCESVEKEEAVLRIGAIMGLGLAYAGTQKEEVLALLSPVVADSKVPMEVAGFAALSLGLVFVASCNEDAAQAIIRAFMERETDLSDAMARYLCLGLGLLFLGKQEVVDATVEVAKTFPEKVSKYCQVTLDSCAYAGTGNVLKIQELLAMCGDHLEGKNDMHQGAAVLGIGMIAMAEELGTDMAIRALSHLLQYGDQPVRRAVPLALGLLSVSNPKINVMDTLSRLSHDSDSEVAMGAIVSLGLLGAGTNNARMAGILRSLSSYYYKDPSALFFVRLAQGLTHLGKGLLTLNPYHSDRFLLSSVALAGLSAFLHSCLDMKGILLGRYHYALYYLVPAMQPRMLLTLDEELKPLSVTVRVGQAVDVVGQAGRPKTITGFQTHGTPVLLPTGDRAELATNKYVALTHVLEGFVVLKRNPDFVEDHLSS
eukprot:TRINITY_DN1402_c0_g1_i1.p1 TRINITY_DN1402_c0_g1~~TRINITY_DN1402_c0_g1_i1.p1  ORF type:complete len:915 (+),score=203.59 TRINITY_DN1402_c0_g1_i1:289-3033(+)